MDDQRLTELETKVSHQDFVIEELNDVIYKQQETIDRLEAKLKTLTKRIDEALGSEVGPGNEKPPHY